MIYKLLRKTFGTKEIVDLARLDVPSLISDICWVNDLGLVYSTDRTLGLLTAKGEKIFPWKGDNLDDKLRDGNNPVFGYLSGLSYFEKLKIIFVAENGGRNIRAINLEEDYTSTLFKKQMAEIFSLMMKNVLVQSKVFIEGAGRDKVFIASPDLRKCFFINGSSISHVAGDGKCRFANGQNGATTSIGMPSGISSYNGKVLIADSFKNIIRSVDGNSINILLGHPHDKILDEPSKLVVRNGVLYIQCKNSVRNNMLGKKVEEAKAIYESDNIVNIAADSEGGLYILEVDNAKS